MKKPTDFSFNKYNILILEALYGFNSRYWYVMELGQAVHISLCGVPSPSCLLIVYIAVSREQYTIRRDNILCLSLVLAGPWMGTVC